MALRTRIPTPVRSSSTAARRSPSTRPITGIHVRGEAGNDTFQADPDVTLPLWLYGGNGNNTLTGGAGNNVIVGGSGQNTIHSSNGVSTPQTVDDQRRRLDRAGGLLPKHRQLGPAFPLPGPSTARSNRTRRSTGSDNAEWTFANLDPSGYYDVYVTWSPIAGASTAAQYEVDDGTPSVAQTSIATVNQTQAPADLQEAGVFWHDLGVYQAGNLGDADRAAWHGR